MDSIITVRNLTKRFGNLVAVDHISFDIEEGEIFGLLGPNGAGKTTTIHMLATILKPDEGTAIVAGHDIRKEPKEVRKKIGIVFQDITVDRALTGYENMWISGKLYGLRGKELDTRIRELLEFVDLLEWKDVQVRKYSGGMMRRLEIARGLLHEPEILFLDEPTLGLDPQTRANVWSYIMRLKKERDMTILLTTHYMDEAEKLSDRVAIIDHGKIIALDTPDGLKNMVGEDIVYIYVDPRSLRIGFFINKLKEIIGSDSISFSRNMISLSIKNAPDNIPKIFLLANQQGVRITRLEYTRASLDDVFLKLTGRRIRDEEGSFRDFMRARLLRFRRRR
ncbi:MAG: ATP-binding cassette domain-containing protein [Candidatus Njordarchaeales archaeon]